MDGERRSSGIRPNRAYEITTAAVQSHDRTRFGGHRVAACSRMRLRSWAATFTSIRPSTTGSGSSCSRTRLSQLGPGVAWFDYDRDGDEDLVGRRRARAAGSASSATIAAGWSRDLTTAWSTARDLTTVLGLAGAGQLAMIVGDSSWEGAGVPSALSMASGSQWRRDCRAGPCAHGAGVGRPDLWRSATTMAMAISICSSADARCRGATRSRRRPCCFATTAARSARFRE